MSPTPLASLRAVSKSFGETRAVQGVDLDVASGEVLAVVGENGAGKSTLMRMLAGIHAPDSGQVDVAGRPLAPRPAAAIAAGIGMVHQHFMLVGRLSVAENVVLGEEPRRGFFLDLGRARAAVRELSREHGLAIDPDRLVDDLSVGERQRVEILKVLYRGTRLLVLDEPTAVLTPDESRRLITMARAFAAREGHAVVIVSHKLDEVLSVADRIVVLRRGCKVSTALRGATTAEELADAMVGRHVELPRRTAGDAPREGSALLELRGLKVRRDDGTIAVDGICLGVRGGEIVGVAGVEGNGQAELVSAVAGLARPAAGSIVLSGRDVSRLDVAERQALGLAVIHEDRQLRGLLLGLSVAESFALGRTSEWTRRGLFDRGRLAASAAAGMKRFDVRADGPTTPVAALSGGNQQKVVCAREVGRQHVVLVAAQPTRGVDIGAIEVIYRELLADRARGAAILLISADLGELRALCDRILVLYRGRIVGEATAQEASDERLGRWMTGAESVGEARDA
ncbi:MAG: ABC transporter ATP-binding protein [Deltaproteobacteria bacterium]|nr:ABC transporter ATP-binding protein [Deltaproteobacteria bacterium]